MSLCNKFRNASLKSSQLLNARCRSAQAATHWRARTAYVPHSCRQSSQVNTGGLREGLVRHSPALRQFGSRGNPRSLQHDTLLRNRAFIALGSNMGDRIAEIEKACKEMNARGKVRILRTSSLYETKAMYVLDQDNFVNGACEVRYFVFAEIQC